MIQLILANNPNLNYNIKHALNKAIIICFYSEIKKCKITRSGPNFYWKIKAIFTEKNGDICIV